jgi:hypothetical protein
MLLNTTIWFCVFTVIAVWLEITKPIFLQHGFQYKRFISVLLFFTFILLLLKFYTCVKFVRYNPSLSHYRVFAVTALGTNSYTFYAVYRYADMWVGTPVWRAISGSQYACKNICFLSNGDFSQIFSSQCIRNWRSPLISCICKEVGNFFPLLPVTSPFTRLLTHKSQFVSPAV